MTDPKYQRVAFQSLRKLFEYDLSEMFDEVYLDEVIRHGFRRHFRSPDDPVKVWFDFGPAGSFADIHLEVLAATHHTLQPWVISLCADPDQHYEVFGEVCPNFEESPTPFLLDGSFYWPCETLNSETTLQGLKAWADHFWPDWSPTFEEAKIYESSSYFDELEEAFQEVYLLSPPSELTAALLDHLHEEGFMIVSVLDEGIIVHTTSSRIPHLQKAFPKVTAAKLQTTGEL